MALRAPEQVLKGHCVAERAESTERKQAASNETHEAYTGRQ